MTNVTISNSNFSGIVSSAFSSWLSYIRIPSEMILSLFRTISLYWCPLLGKVWKPIMRFIETHYGWPGNKKYVFKFLQKNKSPLCGNSLISSMYKGNQKIQTVLSGDTHRFIMYPSRTNHLKDIKILSLLFLLFFHIEVRGTCSVADQQITLPKGTVEGVLDNGLHYIILPNELPRHNVEVRLIMKVGSLMETDSQKGCAHFLEHMTFAGTKHFPGHSLIDYFERQGMKYGRDINAFTGFDRTVLWLSLPIDHSSGDIIDSTLLVMSDWLGGKVRFDSARIDRERGVILEELRSYDPHDDFFALKIGDNRYAQRLPLGTETDIKGIDRDILQKFYHKWYTPQLGTIVIVGNVNGKSIETKLRARLSGIPSPYLTIPSYPFEYEKGIRMQEVRDTLRSDSKLELIIPHTSIPTTTVGNATRKLRMSLLVDALSKRMAARNIHCDISDSWYMGDNNHFVLSFQSGNKKNMLKHIKSAATELRNISKKGLLLEELEDIVSKKSIELVPDSTQQLSADLCDDMTDYVMTGCRNLYLSDNILTIKKCLQKTTSIQLQEILKQILLAMHHTTLIAYTNKEGDSGEMDTTEIMNAWKAGWKMKAQPYHYKRQKTVENKIRLPKCITVHRSYDSTKVLVRKYYDDLNITELTLQNGIKILLRPTLDGNHTLYFTALKRGGTADLNDEQYHRYKDAVSYMDMGGLAKINADTLLTIMEQENLSMTVGISNYWNQILGSCPVKNAGKLFNIINEKIHAPQLNYVDFKEVRDADAKNSGKETMLEKMIRHDSDRMMNNRLDSLVGNSLDHLHRPSTKADIQNLSLDTLASYYTRLLSDPKGTTVILTGNFQLAQIEKQVIAIFSDFSRPKATFLFKDEPFKIINKPYIGHYENDNKTQVVLTYVYPGNYQPALRNTLILKLMRDLLQERLLSVLRERANIVYSPYADVAYAGRPQQSYYFTLNFSVKKENRELADSLLNVIIDKLSNKAVSDAELNKMKRSFMLTKQKTLSNKAPVAWRTTLTSIIKNGETIADFNEYDKWLDSITPPDICQAFAKYIQRYRQILFIKE